MPQFDKQFYSDTVPENIELHSPLSVLISAMSPMGRKLIYSIVKGNELEEFAVDFNTGMYCCCHLYLPTCHRYHLTYIIYILILFGLFYLSTHTSVPFVPSGRPSPLVLCSGTDFLSIHLTTLLLLLLLLLLLW
jgi:hypothetical protein